MKWLKLFTSWFLATYSAVESFGKSGQEVETAINELSVDLGGELFCVGDYWMALQPPATAGKNGMLFCENYEYQLLVEYDDVKQAIHEILEKRSKSGCFH